MSGRRASDWLSFPPRLAAEADERGREDRRAESRRGGERRAPKRKIDVLFCATLVNHIAPDRAAARGVYETARSIRPGIIADRRV